MKRTLFSKANLYLLSVIIGVILILFVIYNIITSDNAVAGQNRKEYLLLIIWIAFTIVNFLFYKKELGNRDVKK